MGRCGQRCDQDSPVSGHLAGYVGRACDSWACGPEFKPQLGWRRLKENKINLKRFPPVFTFLLFLFLDYANILPIENNAIKRPTSLFFPKAKQTGKPRTSEERPNKTNKQAKPARC